MIFFIFEANLKKLTMESINNQLNTLFDEWKESLIQEYGNQQEVFFTRDGLMYNNNMSIEDTDLAWKESDKRIMFILKDQPSVESDDDARLWIRTTVMDNVKGQKQKEANRTLKTKFLRIITRLFWGLYNSNKEWLCWFDEAKTEDIISLVNNVPFAFVESKKLQGKPEIKDKELSEHLSKFGAFLQREIDILNPNFIVCMGQPIYDFVLKFFKEKGCVTKVYRNLHVYEAEKENEKVTILYSGHPSSRSSEQAIYDGAMEWYRYYIDPNYAKLCNK